MNTFTRNSLIIFTAIQSVSIIESAASATTPSVAALVEQFNANLHEIEGLSQPKTSATRTREKSTLQSSAKQLPTTERRGRAASSTRQAAELAIAQAERDIARLDCNSATTERDKLQGEYNAQQAELAKAQAERDKLQAEREARQHRQRIILVHAGLLTAAGTAYCALAHPEEFSKAATTASIKCSRAATIVYIKSLRAFGNLLTGGK